MATFKDLCPEDRGKIQKLISELVMVKRERDVLAQTLNEQDTHHQQEVAKMKADNIELMNRLRRYMSIVSESQGQGLDQAIRPQSAAVGRLARSSNLTTSVLRPTLASKGIITDLNMKSWITRETQTNPDLGLTAPTIPALAGLPVFQSHGMNSLSLLSLQNPMLSGVDTYGREIMQIKEQLAALSQALPQRAPSGRASSPSGRRVRAEFDANQTIPTFSIGASSRLKPSELDHHLDSSIETNDTMLSYIPLNSSIVDAIQDTLPDFNKIDAPVLNKLPIHMRNSTSRAQSPVSDVPRPYPTSTVGTAGSHDEGDTGLRDIVSETNNLLATVQLQQHPSIGSSQFSNSLQSASTDGTRDLLTALNHSPTFVTPPSGYSALRDPSVTTPDQVSYREATAMPSIKASRTPTLTQGNPLASSYQTPQVYTATTQRGLQLEVIEPPSFAHKTPSPPASMNTAYSLADSSSMKPIVSLPGHDFDIDRSTGSAEPVRMTNYQTEYYPAPSLLSRRPFPSDFDESPHTEDVIVRSRTIASHEDPRVQGQRHNLSDAQISDDVQHVTQLLNRP
ncbi:hypothetical protein GMRT_16295 [Giardia muris]|uniref:Uncharacterized protein n=1 Tax=Giardia muris TaxID=5742 RepID=A0A4Z1TAU8_GIAMU|nr:hypothetical protein GMRT_16295 [Giardia muris]|eukprot:TNJ29641.1 hypothetical protein GMRT_16295 [Giardia muris]